jgi:hypothetical protein
VDPRERSKQHAPSDNSPRWCARLCDLRKSSHHKVDTNVSTSVRAFYNAVRVRAVLSESAYSLAFIYIILAQWWPRVRSLILLLFNLNVTIRTRAVSMFELLYNKYWFGLISCRGLSYAPSAIIITASLTAEHLEQLSHLAQVQSTGNAVTSTELHTVWRIYNKVQLHRAELFPTPDRFDCKLLLQLLVMYWFNWA